MDPADAVHPRTQRGRAQNGTQNGTCPGTECGYQMVVGMRDIYEYRNFIAQIGSNMGT